MPLSGAERQKRYRERLKQENPLKFEEKRKAHIEKVKLRQKKIAALSDEEKHIKRLKWREDNKKKKLKKIVKTQKQKEAKLKLKREYVGMNDQDEEWLDQDEDDTLTNDNAETSHNNVDNDFLAVKVEEDSTILSENSIEETDPLIRFKRKKNNLHNSSRYQNPESTVRSGDSYVDSTSYDDEFDIYGKHIATQLRAMDLQKALKLQLEIQSLVSEARISDIRGD